MLNIHLSFEMLVSMPILILIMGGLIRVARARVSIP
jgi:hypothetical protein